jgi:hypothetical protein
MHAQHQIAETNVWAAAPATWKAAHGLRSCWRDHSTYVLHPPCLTFALLQIRIIADLLLAHDTINISEL